MGREREQDELTNNTGGKGLIKENVGELIESCAKMRVGEGEGGKI